MPKQCLGSKQCLNTSMTHRLVKNIDQNNKTLQTIKECLICSTKSSCKVYLHSPGWRENNIRSEEEIDHILKWNKLAI